MPELSASDISEQISACSVSPAMRFAAATRQILGLDLEVFRLDFGAYMVTYN